MKQKIVIHGFLNCLHVKWTNRTRSSIEEKNYTRHYSIPLSVCFRTYFTLSFVAFILFKYWFLFGLESFCWHFKNHIYKTKVHFSVVALVVYSNEFDKPRISFCLFSAYKDRINVTNYRRREIEEWR